MPATNEARWRAIDRRDPAADGTFVYAVRTTGVYCRPSCPSRKPNPSNVLYFDDAERAAHAGFRPCRRCGGVTAALPDAVRRACRRIESADKSPSLPQLAAAAGLSPAQLHRHFKKWLGVTPKAYANTVRMTRLRDELAASDDVTRSVRSAGYQSAARLYEHTAKVLGMTPRQYRNGAPGLEVRYALARCSLGWVIVAATDRGICLTHVGDAPEPLHALLRRRFPEAEQRDDPQLMKWLKAVVAKFDDPGRRADVPLDIRGTAFQHQVWEALRAIPAGETVSYTEIARRIGRPKAVRAVGNACGKNPAAPIIPCHRVLASDGSLGGFGFGLDRKQAMLDREKAGTGTAGRSKTRRKKA